MEDSWRAEVASRLTSYRAKRKRSLAGQFCMRFDASGEPVQPKAPGPVVRVEPVVQTAVLEEPEQCPALVDADESSPQGGIVEVSTHPEAQEAPCLDEPAPAEEPVVPRFSVPFKRKIVMEPNVIEFPRLFPDTMTQPLQTLAEPVADSSPRILDAPEIAEPLIQAPMFENMRLGGAEPESEETELELPIQVAGIAHRAYASAIDIVVVLAGTALFIAVAAKMMDSLQWSKPLAGAMAAVPLALWWIYEYLFLVYNGRTVGMQLTGTTLRTFQGQRPARSVRRKRTIGMLLSCVSLALGFLWALFDEDELCWHDRISGTYVAVAGERALPSA